MTSNYYIGYLDNLIQVSMYPIIRSSHGIQHHIHQLVGSCIQLSMYPNQLEELLDTWTQEVFQDSKSMIYNSYRYLDDLI